MSRILPPRVVIAGTHSGVGKTTVAVGMMAALTRRGRKVGAAKVGPDFIDPGYHAAAVDRPSRNLDAWISGADAIAGLAARAGDGCEMLVVEGVMGMFDGAGDGSPTSTADVAELLGAPVLLVVDAAAISQSVAAIVHGFASYDERVDVAGVVLNRVGSDAHAAGLVDALLPLGVPVVATLPRDPELGWRDRHLGLVPVAEQRGAMRDSLDRLAVHTEAHCDLDLVERIARAAPTVATGALPSPKFVGRARVAVAAEPAFSFMYPDNIEALTAAGAEILPFDPTGESALPDGADGLVAGGGFPEVYGAELAANRPLLDDVARRADEGLVIWAECGGMLWLARHLDGRPMAGVIPADTTMTDRLTLGYRDATIRADSPLGARGTRVRGHEFHYSASDPPGDSLAMHGRNGHTRAGFADRCALASYLHLHLANRPDIAERFVATAAGRSGRAANAPVALPGQKSMPFLARKPAR